MGKKDTITKEYMRDPAVFADAFNKFLYHGKQVIKPENLTELDTTEIALPYGEGDAGVPEQKYRDVLKLAMTDGDAAYCILGIEGASGIHYAIPVKNLLYDAMQLARQAAQAAKSHRQKHAGKAEGAEAGGQGTEGAEAGGRRTEGAEAGGQKTEATGCKPSPDEYLSGFYKTDRLLPVVTLTIFFGPEKWDGPLTLKEMYAPADDALMQYAPDYKVNLIAPEQMSEEEIGEFKSSLKEVMLYIKYSKDKARLQEVTQKEPNFHQLDRQAAEVINVTTNSKLKYPEGKERIDMCTAIQEMAADNRREGRLEGELKGTVDTYKEVGFSLQEAVQRIAEKFSFSLQRAEEEVKKYWQQ